MSFSQSQLDAGEYKLLTRAEFSQASVLASENASQDSTLAVIFFDLDRFATVNRALGHEAGYQALEIVAKRLLLCFNDAQAIAHLGNDEFAILLADTETEQLTEQTQKALNSIREQIVLPQQKLLLTASAGISTYPDKAKDAFRLIDQATTAVASVKNTGGNSYCFFDANAQKRQLDRFNLELDLRYALAQSEISVNYQAKYDIANDCVNGLEALARWRHPELGWIAPQEFISIAEDSGLIAAIGSKVLEVACDHASRWLTDNPETFIQRDFQLAVNLSAQQIHQRQLVKTVERILQKTAFPAKHLTLEITESLFIETDAETIDKLAQLRAMGIRIAIDDFGTGYSSLSLLKKFPADELKIDKQFVNDVVVNSTDATITRAVIDIAHALSLKVVAEGVENRQQLAFLKEAGCDTAQGYLISKPVLASEVPALIEYRI